MQQCCYEVGHSVELYPEGYVLLSCGRVCYEGSLVLCSFGVLLGLSLCDTFCRVMTQEDDPQKSQAFQSPGP